MSAGAVAALVVGFVTGYCCGRRCHKDDNTLVGNLGYPDTEYEYFEQRGGLARPTLLDSRPPPLPSGAPLGPGAPLLPQETAKLDNRHEEVVIVIAYDDLDYKILFLGDLCRTRASNWPPRL